MRLRLPLARIVSVLLFAALCAIVAAWALQLLAPRSPIAPSGAVAQAQPPTDLSAAGQLFGGAPRPVDSIAEGPSNIQVAGVLAAGARGVALLAIDGRPAKPFAVGESLADGSTVRAVTGDAVELERGGRPMRLAAPARGSIEVLTSGPQRTSGAAAPPAPAAGQPPPAGLPPTPGLPPLPARALPPAGAAATAAEPVAMPQPAPGAPGPSFVPGAPGPSFVPGTSQVVAPTVPAQ
jgi:general secretion pathway protein C